MVLAAWDTGLNTLRRFSTDKCTSSLSPQLKGHSEYDIPPSFGLLEGPYSISRPRTHGNMAPMFPGEWASSESGVATSQSKPTFRRRLSSMTVMSKHEMKADSNERCVGIMVEVAQRNSDVSERFQCSSISSAQHTAQHSVISRNEELDFDRDVVLRYYMTLENNRLKGCANARAERTVIWYGKITTRWPGYSRSLPALARRTLTT
jgi:hypothetical protein